MNLVLPRKIAARLARLWLAVLPAACCFATVTACAEPTDPLGWRLGVAAWSFNRFTFFEAVDRTAALDLRYIEAFEGQRVSAESEATLNPSLPDTAIATIREKLKAANVTLTSIYIHELSVKEPVCRRSFEFARKLGVQTIISEPRPEALDHIERLCEEFGINVALHNHPRGSSRYWHPRKVLKVLEGRSPRLGACADLGHWQRSGIRPVEGIRLLGSRLISLHVKDLDEMTPEGQDVWWGDRPRRYCRRVARGASARRTSHPLRHRVRAQLGGQPQGHRRVREVLPTAGRHHQSTLTRLRGFAG